MDRLWFRFSVAGLFLAVVTLAVSLVPPAVGYLPGWWVYWVLFPGAFLACIRVVMLQHDGVNQNDVLKSSPRGARVAIYVLVVFFFCNLVVGFFLAPGEPVQYGSSYFFNDHGDLIRVSHTRYRLGQAAWTSGFVALSAIFFYVST